MSGASEAAEHGEDGLLRGIRSPKVFLEGGQFPHVLGHRLGHRLLHLLLELCVELSHGKILLLGLFLASMSMPNQPKTPISSLSLPERLIAALTGSLTYGVFFTVFRASL